MPSDNKGNPHGEYSLGGFKGKGKGKLAKQKPSRHKGSLIGKIINALKGK